MIAQPVDIDRRSRAATTAVLELMIRNGEPLTLVDSPPGAGKTSLVETVAAVALAQAGWRVAVATPRVEQGYDLLRRLIANFHLPRLELLIQGERHPPAELIGGGVHVHDDPDQLAAGPSVVVGSVKKFGSNLHKLDTNDFDLLVIDEAYQVAAHEFFCLAPLALRVLIVGDPGQLPPVTAGDTTRFEGAERKVHWPAPRELRRQNPALPTVTLPATRRLPQNTVDVIQPALYAQLPFVSAVPSHGHQLRFNVGVGLTPVDRALAALANGASLVALTLPGTNHGLDEVDPDLSALMADAVDRFLRHGPEWVGRGVIGASDIGCVDAHVRSEGELRTRLLGLGHVDTMVSTPEIWQGLQRPIMVIKHPLSGVSRPSVFDLEPGRLCVMLSRHQIGCVIVGRDDIGTTLDEYQHECGDAPAGADDLGWRGFNAHKHIWDHLENSGLVFRV